MEESIPESQHRVRSYGDIWNERDYAKIPDIVSESFVLYDPSVPKDERVESVLERQEADHWVIGHG